MIELKGHPYFIACQFHPEFKSRPTHAHPLFRGLVEAAVKRTDAKKADKPEVEPAPVKSSSNGKIVGGKASVSAFGTAAAYDEDGEEMVPITLDDIRQSIAREG
jgi:hypothetical protein